MSIPFWSEYAICQPIKSSYSTYYSTHSSNGRETVDKAESEREAFKAVSKLKNKVSEMTGANHNRNGAKNCAQKKKILSGAFASLQSEIAVLFFVTLN